MKIRKCFLNTVTAVCITVSAAFAGSITASADSVKREYKGSLPVDGDTFTVMSCMADDLDVMLPMWEEAHGIDKDKVKLVDFQIGGGEATEAYDRYFLGGEDVDVFIAEPDWALKYLNDSKITVPMSELGFSDTDFSDQYAYSRELCKATKGKNKGKQTASMYTISAGVWCYRTDLAEKYLGVTSPDEMQKLVSDWDGFEKTAAEVYTASKGKTALTASLQGIWDAYKCGYDYSKSAGFRDSFIDLAKNMYDKGYVSHNDQWTDSWYTAGVSDDVMGYFVPTWGFGDAILDLAAGGQKGKTYGKWAACQGPQAYYKGGNMICVSANTDNADLAADFIDYFTVDKKGMRTYVDTRSTSFGEYFIPNSQTVTQDIIDSEYNGLGVLGGESALEALDANAKAVDIKDSITPYNTEINTSFIDAVWRYCKGDIESKTECFDAYRKKAEKYMPETDSHGNVTVYVIDEETGELFDEDTESQKNFYIIGGYSGGSGGTGATCPDGWDSSKHNPHIIESIPTQNVVYTIQYVPTNHDRYNYEIDKEKSGYRFDFSEGNNKTVKIYMKKNYLTNPAPLKGDVDLDGEVSLSDVTAVTKYNLNNSAYPLSNETAYSNADMNDDGKVDVIDVSALIEVNLGR